VEVLALQQLRNRVLGGEAHKLVRAHCSEPAPIEIDDRFLRIENLEYLRLVRLGIVFDLLPGERRPRDRTARGIANHSREIADQENCRVPEVLKVFQLAQHHRVAEMQVGGGGIHAEFHSQGLPRGA